MEVVAADLETHLIQPGLAAPPLVVGAFANSERAWLTAKQDTAVAFEHILEFDRMVGANIVYDLGVISAHAPSLLPQIFRALEEGRVHDVQIREALHGNAKGTLYRDPRNGQPLGRYSLAFLEDLYLGRDRTADKENGWRYRYATLEDRPLGEWPTDAIDYPKADAKGTLEVFYAQKDHQNLQCEARELQAAFALRLMSMWGMRTDPVMVAEVVGAIKKEHEANQQKFFRAGLVKLRKPKKDEEPDYTDAMGAPACFQADTAAIKALVEKAYDGVPPKTDKGATKTDRDTLEESGDELLEAYADAGVNKKLFAVYCDVLEQGTSVPICASYNVYMSTDRTSCEKPNLQQLPRNGKIRECFTPREGRVFCSVDYNTIELASLSQVCLLLFGASKMAEAINEGQDLHTALAADFIGIDYAEAMVRKKAEDKQLANLRQAAKEVNFGFPGMMGPPKLVLGARKKGVRFCELTGQNPVGTCGQNEKAKTWYDRPIAPVCAVCLEWAAGAKQKWLGRWPEMVQYHEMISMLAEECKSTGNPIESLSEGGMLRKEESPSAIANHFFQNLTAVNAKKALWELSKECYTDTKSVLYENFRPVAFLHDEVVAEIREEVAHECALRQVEVMVSVMQRGIPDVLITAEPALMRRWYKGAKTVYVDGRLVPWEPKGEAK